MWFSGYNINPLMVVIMNKIRRQKYPLISFKIFWIAMVLPCFLYFCPFAFAEVGQEPKNSVVVHDIGEVEHLYKVGIYGTLFNEPYFVGESTVEDGSGSVESSSFFSILAKEMSSKAADERAANSIKETYKYVHPESVAQ